MKNLWVLDTKCKVSPESSLPQDGSAYYYGRSAVPASSKEQAIEQLTQVLDDDHIKVEEVLNAVRADEGDWPEDDDFEVHDSIEEAEATNAIALGCFVSEKSL